MFSAIVATQLRKGEFEAIVLSDEKDIYCRCTTPYIVTGEAQLCDAIQPESMIESYGPKIVHEKAISINTKKKHVLTKEGHIFDYDYLVIATGASPFVPQIKGIDSEKVYTVRNSSDMECIQGCLGKSKSAVVVGAGVIGIEMAGALRARGLDVSLVEYASSLSSGIADKEFSKKIISHLEENGIRTMFRSKVVEINDASRKRKEIVIKKGRNQEKLVADFVVVAAGIRPNLDVIEGTKIKANQFGILVDGKMQTNAKDVYACGDCAVPISAVTGKNEPSSLASSAIQQSKIVGYQMASFPIKYAGSTGAFAFQTLGKEYAAAGLTEEEARKKFRWVVVGRAATTDVYKDLERNKPLDVKLIFAGPKMRLVGYEGFGNGVIASAEVASFAIGLRLNILKVLKFNYIAHPSLTPWPFMNPIIMATEDAVGSIMKKIKVFFGKK
ncbi:MAG: FAD-dependent pyridine nucleotide-disulfide oxidoreductase [Parcubacteria group bacterium GW2011_GWC1_45_14]|nr:MAG: FAD-dependent pyridine nucleotide-disulfide oxidoreductase [Candidatus Moranbacteria bacterium GW2011_GWC2_45_10]KKT95490.1 MAG: FAD-dependent pyridine nucleotide-disulfide oxidoreductase [Parcubacteria group bacterium GW2011_GWC1_45_14]